MGCSASGWIHHQAVDPIQLFLQRMSLRAIQQITRPRKFAIGVLEFRRFNSHHECDNWTEVSRSSNSTPPHGQGFAGITALLLSVLGPSQRIHWPWAGRGTSVAELIVVLICVQVDWHPLLQEVLVSCGADGRCNLHVGWVEVQNQIV